MAEYIDIARIDDWNDLLIIDDNGYAISVYDVGELPRANVVEREKIDTAIEEMNSIGLGVVMDCDEMRDYCVEILKRNIGESK